MRATRARRPTTSLVACRSPFAAGCSSCSSCCRRGVELLLRQHVAASAARRRAVVAAGSRCRLLPPAAGDARHTTRFVVAARGAPFAAAPPRPRPRPRQRPSPTLSPARAVGRRLSRACNISANGARCGAGKRAAQPPLIHGGARGALMSSSAAGRASADSPPDRGRETACRLPCLFCRPAGLRARCVLLPSVHALTVADASISTSCCQTAPPPLPPVPANSWLTLALRIPPCKAHPSQFLCARAVIKHTVVPVGLKPPSRSAPPLPGPGERPASKGPTSPRPLRSDLPRAVSMLKRA